MKEDSERSFLEQAHSNFQHFTVIFIMSVGNIEKIEKLLVQSAIQTRFSTLYDTNRSIASYPFTRISVNHKR